ncbi:MAG: flavin monoamine oxidase family protein [Flavisolibacter sp.]
MQKNNFEVIIIGAGASGLVAALELALTGKGVAVVEARDRIGGRAHTIVDDSFDQPVELGAEFVHGNLEHTWRFLKKAGLDSYEVEGEMWQHDEGKLEEQKGFIEDYSALNKKFKELDHDISVAEFFESYLQEKDFEGLRFTLKNYVEGYYAADTLKSSTYSLRDELSSSDSEQYRVEGGYVKLMDYLVAQCQQKGVVFFLSSPVQQVNWEKNSVEVICTNGEFYSDKLLVTVPIGVLQSEKIRFSPALPLKMAAARKLGFGPVVKTLLQFDEAFWKNKKYTGQKNLEKLGFIFSSSVVPTWWTYYPKDSAMITGWSGGPHAEELKELDDEAILVKALESLSEIFSISFPELKNKLRSWHVANWIRDPYCCGGYSYEVVDGMEVRKQLREPEKETLFFTGEGLCDGPEIGTVEAALSTGRDAAHQMVASFKN